MARSVSGRVTDMDGVPVEFVNAVLFSQADSAFIAGAVTDADGNFAIQLPDGTVVFLRLSAIGYSTQESQVPDDGEFGDITMSGDALQLGEVVVRSSRPVTAIRGNALVTRVEGSPLTHAGTANDVLRQVPMVLGLDGNFEVFGKGAPAIYINGRIVQDNSELAQLSSADIRDVEVITNPGVKYDASVKSVIRIRTRRPQGDGFSGTVSAQGIWQHYLRNVDRANLKYRSGGLEIFANFGYITGRFDGGEQLCRMLTRSSVLWDQLIYTDNAMRSNDFFGKAGFSYLLNDRHSFGAYYSNGFADKLASYQGSSQVSADGELYDKLGMGASNHTREYPRHHANLYYTGKAAELGIDFNMDYMWRRSRSVAANDESSENFDNTVIDSRSTTRSRLFAEKLVLSYPLWRGEIEVGEEYTSSLFSSGYATDAAMLTGADSRVDEKNIAGFVQIGQQFGAWNVSAGVRYEHVAFDYLEDGQKQADQSRSYHDFFPSLSISGRIDRVQLALSYNHRTQRPTYSSLDGTIAYVNRFTLEGGNPYLQPVSIHSAELMAAWGPLFGKVSYSYKKNPILHTTVPYGEEGDVKLITRTNFPRIQQFEAFVGSQFEFGVWYPKVNVGVVKQWLTVDYGDSRLSLGKPLALVQWQNAVHLPYDAWLNLDMQWMSSGDSENMRVSSSSYVNAKLYKAFSNNRFSVSLEVNDIFNRNTRDFVYYNRDVTFCKDDMTKGRTFMATFQYTFNTSRDRYKGAGAGASELERF